MLEGRGEGEVRERCEAHFSPCPKGDPPSEAVIRRRPRESIDRLTSKARERPLDTSTRPASGERVHADPTQPVVLESPKGCLVAGKREGVTTSGIFRSIFGIMYELARPRHACDGPDGGAGKETGDWVFVDGGWLGSCALPRCCCIAFGAALAGRLFILVFSIAWDACNRVGVGDDMKG